MATQKHSFLVLDMLTTRLLFDVDPDVRLPQPNRFARRTLTRPANTVNYDDKTGI